MAALSPAEIERLGRDGRIEPVARRALVPLGATTVTFIVSGWFRVFRHAAFVHDVTLALAGPGEVLGPGALFGERSAENGAVAITAGSLLLIEPDAVARHAAAAPGLYAAVARTLARRTERVERKLEAVSRATVEARVAAALLEIAEDAGTSIPGLGIRLDLPLSQEDLAALAGTTRETCSSTVAGFGRRGLVHGSRVRGLVLTDPAGLSDLAAVDFRRP